MLPTKTRIAKLNIMDIQKNAQTTKQSKKDIKALWYVFDRLQKMDSKRSKYEDEWDKIDKNFYYTPTMSWENKNFGTSIPYEQLLIDTYLGTLPEGLPIKVESKAGRVDSKQLMMARNTLEHFMRLEMTANQIDIFDKKKARYGTGWLLSSMWYDSRIKNGEISTEWHIGVQGDVDIRKVWIDDRAKSYWKAMDEILQEDISYEEFQLRYKGQKGYKYVDSVGIYGSKTKNEVKQEQVDDGRNVMLYHYWNIYNGKYIIVANESIVIFNGDIEEAHGRLPLIPVQHYSDPESIYGIGIPKRFAFCKPYINEMLNYGLDGAKLNAGYNIFTSWGTEIDWELYSEPGQGTIVNYTGDFKGIQPFQPNVNVAQLVNILQVMENFGSQALGFDPRTSYQAQSDKVGIVAVLKEEQNQRARPQARNRNLGIGHACTIMLINIAKFAPYKYAEKIFDTDTWEVEDYNWCTIELKNHKINMNDSWEIVDITENVGESDEYKLIDKSIYEWEKKKRMKRFGNFFDLKDSALYKWAGLKVEIDTPSNSSSMKSIERVELQETIAGLANQFSVTQDQELLTVMKKLNQRLFNLYWIDPDNMTIESKSDERKKYIAEAMNTIGNFNNPLSQSQPNVWNGNNLTGWAQGVPVSQGAGQLQPQLGAN